MDETKPTSVATLVRFRATLGTIKRKAEQLEGQLGTYGKRYTGNSDHAHCLEAMPKAMEKVFKALLRVHVLLLAAAGAAAEGGVEEQTELGEE